VSRHQGVESHMPTCRQTRAFDFYSKGTLGQAHLSGKDRSDAASNFLSMCGEDATKRSAWRFARITCD
jgi:hypothetical protein